MDIWLTKAQEVDISKEQWQESKDFTRKVERSRGFNPGVEIKEKYLEVAITRGKCSEVEDFGKM